jgi:hypothetical protein
MPVPGNAPLARKARTLCLMRLACRCRHVGAGGALLGAAVRHISPSVSSPTAFSAKLACLSPSQRRARSAGDAAAGVDIRQDGQQWPAGVGAEEELVENERPPLAMAGGL